jgi:hypothetical protein
MTVKQLSVFIENRQGRLGEVLHVLKENNVNILSLSLADTTEYGLLRLIVSDPEYGRDVLLGAGFSSTLTDVLILKVAHTPGSLQSTLTVIADGGINIEYMYGLSIEGTDASIVMKTNQLEEACRLFAEKEIRTATSDEIATLS